jgi:hypothetical protein
MAKRRRIQAPPLVDSGDYPTHGHGLAVALLSRELGVAGTQSAVRRAISCACLGLLQLQQAIHVGANHGTAGRGQRRQPAGVLDMVCYGQLLFVLLDNNLCPVYDLQGACCRSVYSAAQRNGERHPAACACGVYSV